MSGEKITPWDFVKDLSHRKKNLLTISNRSFYSSWVINRAFAYFPDTVYQAEEMNSRSNLSVEMQHDYYFYSIRPRQRFAKWVKKIPSDKNVVAISEYYNCGMKQATEMLGLHTGEDLREIKKNLQKGGQK